eukprot:TRINITY_DN3169_c0_g1_i2.p1 TRINITY_DN3169_c0_g1~~TRINITY_DN3169_c0_g1_i2.p1  ORF type:complete len:454 (+),score=137.92 TRINITY_DN3169_c0_g1_i2:150-1511(+)
MFSWLSGKSTTTTNVEGDAAAAPAAEEGGGVWGFVKGMFSTDQLKVEESGGQQQEATLSMDDTQRKGLFSQMSSLVGKDITSMISLPVWIFEPISFLQVMAEPLEYEHLLQQAAQTNDVLDQFAYVTAFNMALYSRAIRTRKPFNPLLGETFELVASDGRYKFVAEQVSHHPPIGVSCTTTKDYSMQLETELKSKFYGNSSEVYISGNNILTINKTGDQFCWGHVVSCCHNILIGSLWLDHYGDLEIKHTSGYKAVIHFQKAGYFGSGRYVVTGEIMDSNGNIKMKVEGAWNSHMNSIRINDDGTEQAPKSIWTATVDSSVNDNKFKFTKFITEEVINLTPEYEAILPLTDSRLRADRRALEAGDISQAGTMKTEMEEAQRARKRSREAAGEDWQTRYFTKVDDAKWGHVWKFDQKYWQERDDRVAKYMSTKSQGTTPSSTSTSASASADVKA